MNENLNHVPAHLVVDWDFKHIPGAEIDTHLAWKRLHEGPDVVWTPCYGGHWIATRAEAIRQIQTEHDTFGNGPHRCPGANLARIEIQTFLEAWLKRIPDFGVTPGERAVTVSGSVNGVEVLPLTWPVARAS